MSSMELIDPYTNETVASGPLGPGGWVDPVMSLTGNIGKFWVRIKIPDEDIKELVQLRNL